MPIESKYIVPKFKKKINPKIGLLALSTDLTIEKDFYSVCNNLPFDDRHEGLKRRFIRRRKHIVWPWASTVEAALQKANKCVVDTYFVEEHHMVFVIPQSLSSRMYIRVTDHIHNTVKQCIEKGFDAIKSNRIHTHIIQGPDELFDRF